MGLINLGDFIASDRFDALNRRQNTVLICVHMLGPDKDWDGSALTAQARAIQAATGKNVPLYFVFVRAPDRQLSMPMDVKAVRGALPSTLAKSIKKCPAHLISGCYTIGTSTALKAMTAIGAPPLLARLCMDSIRQAIVIGQQRDVCVAATIFGDPNPPEHPNHAKWPGLLDCQMRVITSYDVLVGTSQPIANYKLDMTDMMLGAGSAVTSAYNAATKASTNAALRWGGSRG
jgi:hypothetical protein